MKKVIKISAMWMLVSSLFFISAALTSLYPPQETNAQIEFHHKDTSKALEEAKALIETARQNERMARAMESVKPEKQVIVKERKVYIPVIPGRQPAAAVITPAAQKTTPPAVTVIYQAPKYPGTPDRDRMTYAEWKMQRGLLQSKSYRLYQKYLDGQGN